jgi:hypothetical protein
MSDVPITESESFVATTATRTGRLSLGRLVLLGIYGDEDRRRALLRCADGALLPVEIGDATPLGTVVAIGPDAVHLARAGRVTELLGLPED